MDLYKEKHRSSLLLFIFCWVVYLLIVISRSNYTTAIAFIVREGVFSKSDAGVISAAFYFTYGLFQLIGGRITDKVSPYKIIMIGIAGSVLSNLLLIFFNSFTSVLILWSLNGILQFGVWPAITRLIAAYMLPEHSTKASVFIPLAVACGNILSFCVASPVLGVFGWKGSFVMNVAILIIAFSAWLYVKFKSELILKPQNSPVTITKTKSEIKFLPLFLSAGGIFVVLMAIFQGMLDTGIKSWVPTMMMESYSFSPSWSNVITAGMNICNITGVVLLVRIFMKVKNPLTTQVSYFAICLPACVFLMFVGKLPAIAVFIPLVVATTSTYAMLNLNVRVASSFDKYGYSGTVCGIINASQCVGIVAANGGFGMVAESFGWNSVAFLWCVISAVAILMGIPGVLLWKRFVKNNR